VSQCGVAVAPSRQMNAQNAPKDVHNTTHTRVPLCLAMPYAARVRNALVLPSPGADAKRFHRRCCCRCCCRRRVLLVEQMVEVDPRNFEGWTPLCCAVSRGHVSVVKFLLKKKANAHWTGPHGQTLMHVASWYSQVGGSVIGEKDLGVVYFPARATLSAHTRRNT
jgi:ankyrin repeat protein